MPYDVEITTTNGLIKKEIEELEELKEILIEYYETYISIEAKRKELVKQIK